MRIVAGTLHGRRLTVPSGDLIRPTSGRLREALFNVLAHAAWSGGVEGAVVLDAFAGTGALGLEALSRGAVRVFFFEKNARVRAILAQNIAACGVGARARVAGSDALHPTLAMAPANLVFLDPPYGEALAPRALVALKAAGWIADGALIVVETARAEAPAEALAEMGELLSNRVMGAARASFWRA